MESLTGSITRNNTENTFEATSDAQYYIRIIIWPIVRTMHILIKPKAMCKVSQFILYVVFLFVCMFHFHALSIPFQSSASPLIYTLPPLHHVGHSTLPELFVLQ